MKMAQNTTQVPSTPCTWKINDMKQLCRFLFLGTESGEYLPGDPKLLKDFCRCIPQLIEDGKGLAVVNEIKKFSVEGRIIKQSLAIFALAKCAKQCKDIKTKQAAFSALSDICRTPTHLFQFVDYAENLSEKPTGEKSSGWGRAQRNAVSKWYNSLDPKYLALAVTKYRRRNGWRHVDILRLAHVKAKNDGVALILRYVTKGLETVTKEQKEDVAEDLKSLLQYLVDVETVKHSEDEQQVARLVEKHALVKEHVPTWFQNSQEVWRALIPTMPMEAMIRSLGKITSLNLMDTCRQTIVDKLKNESLLKGARVHPFTILAAWKTYTKGEGERGKKLKWTPDEVISEALENAFYGSMKSVEPTGKRHLLAIDVSGSMQSGEVVGCPQLTPAAAAGAMALLTARTESDCRFMAFSQAMHHVKLRADMNLEEVCHALSEVAMGGTDCSLPIQWALQHKHPVDVFVVYTDCDPVTMTTHPADALRKYRQEMNLPEARLVVCALAGNGFTIADPEDAGMLDIAGFDAAAPLVIRNFVLGNL